MYKPFLIKKNKESAKVFDTMETWNIGCLEIPFIPIGKAKELPVTEWSDEDGDDEYIPDTIPIEAYEIEISLACVCNAGEAYSKIMSFFNYITGRDEANPGGELIIYDTNTGIGRKGVRYSEYGDDAYKMNQGGQDTILFTVKFKVNDPVTQMTLSK